MYFSVYLHIYLIGIEQIISPIDPNIYLSPASLMKDFAPLFSDPR